MKRSTTAVIVGVLALGLAGGGTAMALSNIGEPTPEASASAPAPVGTDAPADASTDAPVASESATVDPRPAYITEPGEVCDPGNANDVICAAFYPSQAVLNIASRNATLSTMDEPAVIALAQQACSVMESGGNYDSAELVPGNDNRSIFSAGALAYCSEYIQGSEKYPDLAQRRLVYYQGIGEAAAKAEFADGTMPTPEKLGY